MSLCPQQCLADGRPALDGGSAREGEDLPYARAQLARRCPDGVRCQAHLSSDVHGTLGARRRPPSQTRRQSRSPAQVLCGSRPTDGMAFRKRNACRPPPGVGCAEMLDEHARPVGPVTGRSHTARMGSISGAVTAWFTVVVMRYRTSLSSCGASSAWPVRRRSCRRRRRTARP